MSSNANFKTILFVHHGHQWIRGSERVLIDHLDYLDLNKYNPILWTNCKPLAKIFKEKKLLIFEDKFSYLFHYKSPKYDFISFFKLFRKGVNLIRQNNVAIVHCNSLEPAQWMAPATKWTKIPLVVQLHLDSTLRSRCVHLAHQASIIVGVCNDLIEPFREDGLQEKFLKVVRNNVDSNRLVNQPKVTRASLGIDDNKFVFLAVGSLLSHKGFDYLIKAFAKLKCFSGNCLLLIIGDGPQRNEFQVLTHELGLADHIMFLGDCPHAPAFMRDIANAFVLPSLRESFGLVLLEAGFYGCPCIASDVGGVGETIIHEETGLLVPPGDLEALRFAMERLVEDKKLGIKLAKNLNKKITQEMLAPKATRQLESLYEELLNKLNSDCKQKEKWHWYPAYFILLKKLASRFKSK